MGKGAGGQTIKNDHIQAEDGGSRSLGNLAVSHGAIHRHRCETLKASYGLKCSVHKNYAGDSSPTGCCAVDWRMTNNPVA